jgi:hypothetical protein
LKANVQAEAKHIYLQLVKKEAKKIQKLKDCIAEEQLCTIMQGPLKIIIKQQAIPKPPPWGGMSTQRNINLVNTCTVDNMLYFMHILFIFRRDILDEFTQCNHPFAQVLVQVHHLFLEEKFSLGKIIWLEQFFNGDGTWDCFAGENEYFFSKLSEFTKTVYTKSCSNPQGNCSRAVQLFQSSCLCTNWLGENVQSVQSCLDDFIKNSDAPSNCPTCILGVRTQSARQFVHAKPPLVFMEIDTCPFQRMPPSINVNGTQYGLFAITYGSGGHFVGCVKVPQKGWHSYNGLELYHGYGPGMKKILQPNAPPGYMKNNAVYVRAD